MKKVLKIKKFTSLKFDLKMKLTTLFLVVSLLQLQAATESYAQKTRVTINLEDVRLESVLNEIESLTEFKFFFNYKEFDFDKIVSVNAKEERISSILKRLFKNTDISFEIIDKQIVLKKTQSAAEDSKVKVNTATLKQEFRVEGTVNDGNGQPLPGANIVEKGTSNGVQSDFDGNFSLKVQSEDAVLVISFIGFLSQEISVDGRKSLTVSLEEDAANLDEVVLIGYGSQKKRNVAGSISSIGGDDVNSAVTGNVTQALAGRAAGVRVETNGGAPGASVNVIIRGTGSLSNQDPLYVVDGVFSDNIDFLNPSDINSVQVLKDASTASIYGARSGQGVVIVTTKKGRMGQPMKVDLDASWGQASVVRKLNFLNAGDFIANRTQAYSNDGIPLPGNFNAFDPSVDSDIQDASLQTALVQNYGMRISGGGENSTYSLSGNRLKQEGVVKESEFERTAFRVNTSGVKGRFSFNQSLFLARSINRPNLDFGREFGHIPVVPIYDETLEGGFAAANTGVAGVTRSSNWLGVATLTERRNTNDNILANASGAFEILDGLKYKLNLSLNYNNLHEFTFTPTYVMSNSDVGTNTIANLTENRSNFLSTIVENLVTYTKSIENHSIDALVGYSEQKDRTETIGVSVDNFLSNDTRTIDAGINVSDRRGVVLPRRIQSLFGRLNYDFAGKYLLTASIRRDGSSNFGEKNRFGVFPAIGLGWNISEESFFNVDKIDNLKVRASWGKLGSDNLIPFQYISALNITSQYTLGPGETRLNGVSQIQFSNPDLKWEETTTTNIGLEASLVKGKINFTADYFKKTSDDILASLPINPSSGTNVAIPFNAATLENKGFEFSLNYNKSEGDFQYALTGNFSTLDNEVISLGEGVNPIGGGRFTDETYDATRTEAGFPVAYFYGYVTNGVYQNQAEIDADNLAGRTAVPGDLRFVDINGDNVLDVNDQTFLGSPIPDFEYSLNFTSTYKGMDFGLFFQGVEGNEIWNGRLFEGVFGQNGNKLDLVNNAWTPNNGSGIPRASIGDAGVNRRSSDFYVEDGSYFRLKNVTLGYTFPDAILNQLSLTKLRAYINVENAFTIDNYSGYFPEIGRNMNTRRQGFGNSLFDRGVDESTYPTARTITLGVQISL